MIRTFTLRFLSTIIFLGLGISSAISGENPPVYATESVLNTGTWFRFGITSNGVYSLDAELLSQLGLNPSTTDPNNIRIYFNGNGPLPEANSKSRIDDLEENDVLRIGGGDGSFDVGDRILFYGQGSARWKYNVLSSRFEHETNPYTETSWYYVCVDKPGTGKTMAQKPETELEANLFINQFLDYQYHEANLINIMMSGRQWYGEEISTAFPEQNFTFLFPDKVKNRKVYIRSEVVGRSITEDMKYSLFAGSNALVDSINLARLSTDSQIHARESNKSTEYDSDADTQTLTLKLFATEGSSRIWLNYLRLNAWRYLNYRNEPLFFRNPASVSSNSVSRFSVGSAQQNLQLWDITNPLHPKIQSFSLSQDSLRFTVVSDSLREYILFNPQQAMAVLSAQPVENQNLHAIDGCELLIISYSRYIEQANTIAQIHYDDDGMIGKVVDVEKIYNEFGCGTSDVTAIRDFIRMIYLKESPRLQYVLLLGDASYDYLDRISENTNEVPTYQAVNSLIETKSYLSDDYYGLMDATEGADMAGSLNLGIGRLPVGSVGEAQIMTDKIRNYIENNAASDGEWRNNLCVFADDGNDNLHLSQAETLANQIDTARFEMNVSKVYIDAYKRQSTTGGYRYPDANTALCSKINEGALIINYTGHGGINGLTDEKVFTINDITALKNGIKMPFFITATCEFSRFDNPHFIAAGEKLLMQANGGAIAMMTTTRVAFSHSNFALNRKLYEAIFSRSDVQPKRLGDIIRIAKTPSNDNIYNFSLLGDPALRLQYPSKKVVTTLFNGKSAQSVSDTLHAMSSLSIKGEITDFEDVKINDFNGFLEIRMFDKRTAYRTLGNDASSSPTNFSYFDKLLYKGKVSVKNGEFEARFSLPRDIAFTYGSVKISYYAYDTLTFDDATGAYGQLIVGGTDPNLIADQNGPEIELYLNQSDFQDGDAILANPVLYAQLTDPQGISFLGTSIGRDILLTINNQSNSEINLNSYYVPDLDSDSSGTLTYSFNSLPVGSYTLTLKAWDLHNNSSEKTIQFTVENRISLFVNNVYNYPNPFTNETFFTFSHNQEDGFFDVAIDIFSIDGKHINTLTAKTETQNAVSMPIRWDGRDASGRLTLSGQYIYEMRITDKTGKKTKITQKLVFNR